jgi:hypothetical protein
MRLDGPRVWHLHGSKLADPAKVIPHQIDNHAIRGVRG